MSKKGIGIGYLIDRPIGIQILDLGEHLPLVAPLILFASPVRVGRPPVTGPDLSGSGTAGQRASWAGLPSTGPA